MSPVQTSDQDASSIAEAIRLGKASARSVVEEAIGRICLFEDKVQAFAHHEGTLMRSQTNRIDRGEIAGPLAGVPIGIKDIFDTFDLPTEFNSPIYAGNQPAYDACVVDVLRRAGAIIAGKTGTAEFAFMHTGPTPNPHDLARTPGSSSAGSAAGVAAGFFQVALGTQTAGSLIKPAAYCGVFAFKPSFGLAPLQGVKALAPSFDTVGWFGRSARDLGLMARVILPHLRPRPSSGALRLGVCRTSRWHLLAADVAARFETAIAALIAAGHDIVEIDFPIDLDAALRDHQTINDREGARSLAAEYQRRPDQLSMELLAMFSRAAALSWSDEFAARTRMQRSTYSVDEALSSFDAILGISCPVVAPLGLKATGSSDFIKSWTSFGLPQANIPLLAASGELTVGLQVIGRRFDDANVLKCVESIASSVGDHSSRLLKKSRVWL